MTWHPDIPEEYRNQIVTGDARVLAERIPDESVDLIFTDPPYLKEYLWTYEWLGIEAKRILKPTGFLLCYAGGYYKPKIFRMLGESLDYFWDYTFEMPGDNTLLWSRKTIARTKSILAYRTNAKAMPRRNVLGHWVGSSQDKRFHIWGQEESAIRYYIELFSNYGQIVVDPFVGGGTTPAMAGPVLGRNYIAFEIDPDTAEAARERVLLTQPPLFVLEPEQMSLELD